jgi:hypothetical protein
MPPVIDAMSLSLIVEDGLSIRGTTPYKWKRAAFPLPFNGSITAAL